MKQVKQVFCTLLLLCSVTPALMAQNLIEDEGIGLSVEEVEHIVSNWPTQMREAAAIDVGDRLELLNMALVTKKMAAQAEGLRGEADPDRYWKYTMAVRNIQREFVFNQYMRSLQVPDMSELAAERYKSDKDGYALVPETRLASHILFLCLPQNCDRREVLPVAKEVMAELNAGANFEEMVQKHSMDAASKKREGRFDRWIKKGEPNVSPPFVGGVFSIEEIGGYSDVVQTQFGFHIIRLEGIREAHHKPYDEVKDAMISRLVGEFRKLKAKEFEASYRMTDDATIDAVGLDAVFAPYQVEVAAEVEAEVEVEAEAEAVDSEPEAAEASGAAD